MRLSRVARINLDRIYVTNRVLGLVGDAPAVDAKSDDLLDILDALLETAVKKTAKLKMVNQTEISWKQS